MRKTGVFATAAVILLATGACVQTAGTGYPGYGYSPGYYSQPSYGYSRPTYHNPPRYYAPPPRVVTQTRYVPVRTPPPRAHHKNWRDRNHDGVPDRWQRRR